MNANIAIEYASDCLRTSVQKYCPYLFFLPFSSTLKIDARIIFIPYETIQPNDTVEVKVQLPSFYGICTCLKTILEELTSLQYTMHDKQCTSPYIRYQKFRQAISVLIEDRLLQFVYFQSFLINHEYRTHYAIDTFDVTICCALTGIRYTQANKKT